jgi:ATP-dependent DNA helicase RecQ
LQIDTTTTMMPLQNALDEVSMDKLLAKVEQYWGYTTLRPLQAEAMAAMLQRKDSLVVLPTGGGKSLCYQAPAVTYDDELTVVVSPLISLMKDQVDGLRACGIAATQIDSSQSASERFAVEQDIASGKIRLLYVSPERFANESFCRMLQQAQARWFVIDEAHCISHWGHDFRPEYRQLSRLKELFPGSSVHAFTATATEDVRKDVLRQLNLDEPTVLVGNFDRPNLTYRIFSRRDILKQVLEVLSRHKKEAGIIYCIRRKEVDELTSLLRKNKVHAVAYHAGLSPQDRESAQEAFAKEECDLVVATIAFGMGIDRSNVRFVMHTGMPKSLEHYQQETGRAGRDSLEAECVLLYSNSDVLLWQSIIEKSVAESDSPDENFLKAAKHHVNEMSRYCRGAICRHRALVEYFGQEYDSSQSCDACDVCLEETELVPEADIIAQKILSCIARIKGSFGVGHIVSVLRGEKSDNIRNWHHDQLSTYGLLSQYDKTTLRDWIDQLYGQGLLNFNSKTTAAGFSFNAVALNKESLLVLKGDRSAKLLQPMLGKKGQSRAAKHSGSDSWDDVDQKLFDALRTARRELAVARGWKPYMIFSDATLRELARCRPSDETRMLQVKGVGTMKLQDFGTQFINLINAHCEANGSKRDNFSVEKSTSAVRRNSSKR